MREIQVLDQNTIDKIAAGEVVERPSSVVKELTENAIDAGATAITVEIRDGGKTLIRITDNGSGIESKEIQKAFLRHATSKIRAVEDLEHIVSLGFRGEALSSIAAVAQVELITKTHTSVSGSRYVIEGGVEKTLEEIGAPDGTTFLVRNLFYNVPARSKFLKTAATEAGYISSLIEQMALSHPDIAFKLIINGQVKLHTSGNYQLRDVIYQVYGKEIIRELLEIDYEDELLKIKGYIGKPAISRGNRNFENYYVNGRYVKDRIISKAIEDAYKDLMMAHKFPFVTLQIQMEGNDLDVNVHPSKMEVRFSRAAEVYELLYQVLWKKLHLKEHIPDVSLEPERKQTVKKEDVIPAKSIPEPFERNKFQNYQQTMQETEKKSQRIQETAAQGFYSDHRADQTDLNRKPETPKSETPKSETPKSETPKSEISKSEKSKSGFSAQKYPKQEAEEPAFPSPMFAEKKNAAPNTYQPNNSQSNNSQINVSASNTKKQPESLEYSPEQKKQDSVIPKQDTPRIIAEQQTLFDDRLLSKASRSRHKIIGQVFDTYWLVEFDEKLFIVDQHAAHEKVYYERLVKQFQNRQVTSQFISPPLILSLTLQEETTLKQNLSYFEDFGFTIEHFGGKEYAISAVPNEMFQMTSEELFLEMLDQLSDRNEKKSLELFASRLATMACKAAVKGNHKMSVREADELMDELLTLENPYHCPHGRPTIISMSRYELEKKFSRIV